MGKNFLRINKGLALKAQEHTALSNGDFFLDENNEFNVFEKGIKKPLAKFTGTFVNLQWITDELLPAEELNYFNIFCYKFTPSNNQKIHTCFKVPSNYVTGLSIKFLFKVIVDSYALTGNSVIKVTYTLFNENAFGGILDDSFQETHIYTLNDPMQETDILVESVLTNTGTFAGETVKSQDLIKITIELDSTYTADNNLLFMPSGSEITIQ